MKKITAAHTLRPDFSTNWIEAREWNLEQPSTLAVSTHRTNILKYLTVSLTLLAMLKLLTLLIVEAIWKKAKLSKTIDPIYQSILI